MDWYSLAFISALFSALAAVSEKKALFSLNVLNFSYIVSIITLLLSIPFFFNLQTNENFTLALLILFLKSIIGAGAFVFVMLSIKDLELSEALPLLALSPGIVAILGAWLIGDSLSLIQWLSVFLVVAGAYLLEMKKNSNGFIEPFKALLNFSKYRFVFFALLLFTVTSLLDRILLKDYNLPAYTFMAFQQLFFAIIFTAVIIFQQKSVLNPVKSVNKNLLYLLILISLFTVVYRYTQIEAVKLAPVALVLSVKRLSVLIAIITGGTWFKEKNLFMKVIAAILILTGVSILVIN